MTMSEPEEYRIRVDADAYEQMVSRADYDALERRLREAERQHIEWMRMHGKELETLRHEAKALRLALDAVVDAVKAQK